MLAIGLIFLFSFTGCVDARDATTVDGGNGSDYVHQMELSIFHLLRDLLYCNNSHRSAHVRVQNELGLSRLLAEEKSQSAIRWEHSERRMNQVGGVSL